MLTPTEQSILGHRGLDAQARATLGAALGNRASVIYRSNLQGSSVAGTALARIPFFTGLLSTTSGINAKVVANTTLYSSNLTTVVLFGIVRCTAATAITVAPQVSIGIGGGFNNIYPNTALTGLNATTLAYVFDSLGVIAASPGTITFAVNVGATATTMTVAVDLFGYSL